MWLCWSADIRMRASFPCGEDPAYRAKFRLTTGRNAGLLTVIAFAIAGRNPPHGERQNSTAVIYAMRIQRGFSFPHLIKRYPRPG